MEETPPIEILDERTYNIINTERTWTSSINRNILHSSRSAYLSALSNTALNPLPETTSESKMLLRFIFNPQEIKLFFGLSQLTQNTGFLLCFLYERPDVFVKTVIANSKRPFLPRLVDSIVPSFFGFFSSNEHMNNAFKFYRTAVEMCKRDLAMRIMRPFFVAPALYRFVEAALTPFVDSFLLFFFTNKHHDSPEIIDYYTDFLCKSIKQASVLIPQQHKNLLKHIRDNNWKFDQMWHVLWIRGLLPLFRGFIAASPLQFYLKNIEIFFKKLEEHGKEIYDVIADTESRFFVPSIAPIDTPPIQEVFIKLGDVVLVAHLVNHEKMMPDIISAEEFSNFPSDLIPLNFWCTVYPKFPSKNSTNKVFESKQYLFPYGKKLKCIESYITQELVFRYMCEWSDLIFDCEVMWTQFKISGLTKTVEGPLDSHQFNTVFQNIEESFSTNVQKQIIYVTLLNLFFNFNCISNDHMLANLNSEWIKFLATRKMDEGEMNFMDFVNDVLNVKEKNFLFFDAVKKIKCIDCYGLHHKYVLLKKAFIQVLKASEGDVSFFIQLILQANTFKFMASFIVLNSLVMKNPMFVDLCTSEEIQSWELADAAWRSIMKQDSGLSIAVSDFSMYLIKQFSPEELTRTL